MFTREDRQALQTMIDNSTITQGDQCTPVQALKAIQTTIKDEEHYWHYRDEIMSDIRQEPQEQVHALNTRITTLVTKCKFTDQHTTETMKIMLLQHAIRYHEAQNWICLQDLATLTYKSLLNHCKQLEQCCKQFQKAQLKGRAELTSLTVTSTRTSIHQDSISTHPKHNNCYRCGYSNPRGDCPVRGQRCYHCNNLGYFSHLCKSRYTNSHRYNTRRPSNRGHSRRSLSRSSSRSPTRSTSHHRCTRRHRSPTPHHIDTITITGHNAASNSNMQDKSSKPTKFNKCKNRSLTPIPSPLATFPTFSVYRRSRQHSIRGQHNITLPG